MPNFSAQLFERRDPEKDRAFEACEAAKYLYMHAADLAFGQVPLCQVREKARRMVLDIELFTPVPR